METTEKKTTEESGNYICGFLAQDVFAFCNVEWPGEMPCNKKQQGIVAKVRSVASGSSDFCWSGAIFPVAWLAYRGMIPQAIISYLISTVYFFISLLLLEYFATITTFAYWLFFLILIGIYIGVMGTQTTKTYYRHVENHLHQLGLRNRKNDDSKELEESLRKQGKPSVLRGILIPLTLYMTLACITDILFTFKHMF